MLGLAPIVGFVSLLWLATADTNVTAGDNEIIWPSGTWSPTPSPCSQEGQAHFAYENNTSISYEFTGTAIYMAILRSNVTAMYTVSVDNDTPVLFDGFHTTPMCDIQFGQTGLSFSPHTVTATLYGTSPQIVNPNSSANNYLEIDAFIYTNPNSSSPSSSSSTPTSAASAIAARSSLNAPAIAGIMIALIGSLAAITIFFYLRRRNKRRFAKRRKTVLDRDSVYYAGRISQFPAPLDSNHVYRMNLSSDMPLGMHSSNSSQSTSARIPHTPPAAWLPLHSVQKSQSTATSEIPLQDLAKEVATLMSTQNQRSVAGRNGEEAPPIYSYPDH